MAYQSMNWRPEDFDSNPLQSFQSGLNMVQQARKAQLEQEKARADMLLAQSKEAREQEEQPLKLEEQRARISNYNRGDSREEDKALMELHQLAHTDPQIAAALLQRHKYQTTLEPVFDEPAPAPKGPVSPQGPPAQGGSPIPDGVEFPQGKPPSPVDQVVPPTENDLFPERPPAPQAPPPGGVGRDELMAMASRAAPGGGMPSDPSLQPQEQPEPATPKGPLLGYRLRANINGQDVVLHDPMQAREAAARNAEGLAGMFQDPKYRTAVTALAGLPGMDPTKAATIVATMMEKDAASASQDARAAAGREVSTENNKRMSAAIGAGAAARQQIGNDQVAATANAGLEAATKEWQQSVNWKQAQAASRRIRLANASAQTTGPDAIMAQRQAVEELMGVARGGVATEAEGHRLLENMAGLLGMPAEALAKFTGKFTDAQMANIIKAGQITQEESDRAIQAAGESYKAKFSAPQYANQGPAVNANFRAHMLGAYVPKEAIPNLWDEQGPQMVLGQATHGSKNKARSATMKAGGKESQPWRPGKVNGKPAKIYSDGSYEATD